MSRAMSSAFWMGRGASLVNFCHQYWWRQKSATEAAQLPRCEQCSNPWGTRDFFCDGDQLRSISVFDVTAHQATQALNDTGTAVRPGMRYVNNFIFVARAGVKAKLASWPKKVPSIS